MYIHIHVYPCALSRSPVVPGKRGEEDTTGK